VTATAGKFSQYTASSLTLILNITRYKRTALCLRHPLRSFFRLIRLCLDFRHN